MATNQTLENLKETSEVGIKGILQITSLKEILFSFRVGWVSIFFSLLFFCLPFIFPIDRYRFIIDIVNSITSFLPNILGFTIAGYSLVIAFIPEKYMLSKITERQDNSKFSYYQKMSSIFALNVIFQGITLIVAYFMHFVTYLDKDAAISVHFCTELVKIINSLALLVISYGLAISLFLIIQIVINIFNFSQTHHFFIVKNKLPK